MDRTNTTDSTESTDSADSTDAQIHAAFVNAVSVYADLEVNVHAAIERLQQISISLHCWQGDDVVGFEQSPAEMGGGLAVTGSHPGRAATPEQLRADLDMALSLIPGRHRLNLHACYGEFSQPTDRDEITVEHFQGWIDWAKDRQLGLDFNPTFFAHANAADGFTLSHQDAGIREFWIHHAQACRGIGQEMGRQLGRPCVNNIWVPDGMKDVPVDRKGPRERLAASLDAIFATSIDHNCLQDAVECKLFGIGSESYVAGSHEFYLGYAITRQKLLCLDAGHFHPTEVISDKLSSVLQYVPEILLHVSRGVRWDSDHVVLLTDEVRAIAQELVRGDFLSRTHIGLDFFDASINRIAAWVIGTRSVLKALLLALLEPAALRQAEMEGDYTRRLALLEACKSLPFGAVWDHYCQTQQVPVRLQWLQQVRDYESRVLADRN